MNLEKEKTTKIKVCGLTRLDDARFASGAGADYLGFIFWSGSKRFVTIEKAKEIIQWIHGPECVGVFVDQKVDDVNEIAEKIELGLIQLHGDESPEYCSLIEKPVIKAFRIDSEMTSSRLRYLIEPYENVVQFYLFDTYLEGKPGGTGKRFKWDILNEIRFSKPYFLSGGISVENCESAIKQVEPYALDLSGSLELEPGIKVFEKMSIFFESIHSINEKRS